MLLLSKSFALVFLLASSDPRIDLVTLQQSQDPGQTLSETRRLANNPDTASLPGLAYLEGDLLMRMDQRRAAAQAFARALSTTPTLATHAQLRVALTQEELNHPEVAAGVSASILGKPAPRSITDQAARLLERTLRSGEGDCRLVANHTSWRLNTASRRRVELARAHCDLMDGNEPAAIRGLKAILEESVKDLQGREAAHLLSGLVSREDSRVNQLLGNTFHHHREFDRAASYLEEVVADYPDRLARFQFDNYYKLVRSHFWQGQFDTAARRFGELASRISSPSLKARTYYQQGRSYELSGNWTAALDSYAQILKAEPTGNFAGAALIGSMRLYWRRGEEDEALKRYQTMRSSRRFRFESARSAIFLAASDLVLGRTDRAPAWLSHARAASASTALEADFWAGRLDELEGRNEEAIKNYVASIRRDAFHPIAQAARVRLEGPLAADSVRVGEVLRQSSSTQNLHAAWILLERSDPGSALANELRNRYRKNTTRGAEFLDLAPVPPENWPIFRAPLRKADELLLSLGLWREGGSAATRHFPATNPSLAVTAANQLVAAGDVRRALLISEILLKRKPETMPHRLLPNFYRKALYPFAYSLPLRRAAERHGTDPLLLASIIREESRFQPDAVSAVSARGLTQFIYPTAKRLADKIGFDRFVPGDLETPDVAIELGAAYLAELGERYENRRHQIVAAYNAGEAQSELWQSYCFSTEPEEFYSKVSFRETRGYLTRVLTSRAQYEDVHGSVASSAEDDPVVTLASER